MEERDYRIGDILYRYKINLSTGEIAEDQFKIVDMFLNSSVKTKHVSDEAKLLFYGGWFDVYEEVGKANSKGVFKYALLAEPDPERALEIVVEYMRGIVEKNLRNYERSRKQLAEAESLAAAITDRKKTSDGK